MREIVIDLETTANGGRKGTSPEAHYSSNKVLLFGHANGAGIHTDTNAGSLYATLSNALSKGPVRIIGHNLKFDLKYLMRDYPDVRWSALDYVCTMHRTYRLSGHEYKFSGLEHS